MRLTDIETGDVGVCAVVPGALEPWLDLTTVLTSDSAAQPAAVAPSPPVRSVSVGDRAMPMDPSNKGYNTQPWCSGGSAMMQRFLLVTDSVDRLVGWWARAVLTGNW